MDELLEYVFQLFEDKQYAQATKQWQKCEYMDLGKARWARNIECLKAALKVKEEQITEMKA